MAHEGGEEERGAMDLIKVEGLLDKNTLGVIKASGTVGDSFGHLMGILNNLDKIPNKKELLPKVGAVFGLMAGQFLSDAGHAKSMLDLQYETPQDRNKRLQTEIEDLKALKETYQLESELNELLREMSSDDDLAKEIKRREASLGTLRKEYKNRTASKAPSKGKKS